MSLPSYAFSIQLYCDICTKVLAPLENPQQRSSRNLGCCGRSVCGGCIQVHMPFPPLGLRSNTTTYIQQNPRFGVYCPFCQSVAKNGDEEALSFRPLPPPYTPAPNSHPPPSYRPLPPSLPSSSSALDEVLHYLRPNDTVLSLSLLYNLPTHIIRNHNHFFSDNLLHTRRTIKIPGPHYSGPSLSYPTEEEQEGDARKSKLKRFQLKTKCIDFDSAEVYLEGSGWDEELAMKNWLADERWVRENPMVMRGMGGKMKEVMDKRGKWGFGYWFTDLFHTL